MNNSQKHCLLKKCHVKVAGSSHGGRKNNEDWFDMYWNREEQRNLGLWEYVRFANTGEENLEHSRRVLRERLTT